MTQLLTQGVLAGFVGTILFSASAPADASETLERIAARSSVNIGYREDRPPMSFKNPEGQITGYSIGLCLTIVGAIKTTLGRSDLASTFVPVTAENRFQAIEKGKIDILCGATTKIISWQRTVDFTDPTFVTGATLMSVADNPVPGIVGLAGKKVATVEGTATIKILKKRLEQSQIPVTTADEGVQAVIKGEVSAFAAGQVVLIGLVITQTSGTRFAIANEFSFEPFALAVPRNDADFRLIANAAIAELNRTGGITPNPRTLVLALWPRRAGLAACSLCPEFGPGVARCRAFAT